MAAATPRYFSNIVSATQGGDAIVGVLALQLNTTRTRKEKRGDGKQSAFDNVGEALGVRLSFSNVAAAHDYMAKAEGNLVVTYRPFGGGSAVTCTIKNVLANSISKNVPTLQDTSIGEVSVDATASYGDSDTFATMVAYS